MSPLHAVGAWLRDTLALIPLDVVRILFVALPMLLGVWVLRLPRAATTPPGLARRPLENLKIWALAALLIQVLIYTVI